MQQVIGTNDQVVSVLKGTPTFNTDIAVARSSLWSGLAAEFLGEIFCQGVLHVGPALTPAQMLDSAIVRLQQAATVAAAINSAEATKILNIARVGLARAYLQKGDNANALTAANLVLPTFTAATVHVDDPQSRGRLSNGVFITSSGTTQIVAGLYRALADPRVPWVDAGINAQDGRNRLYRQTKFPSFTAPIRIASGLEARYIAAEAQLKINGTTAPALTLIAERRTAGNQPAFTGTTTAAILAELMDQRARDFWLEAKHYGDIIRNPTAAALVPPAGSVFYKSEYGNFLPTACLPVPFAEKANNPNF
jgi:starch-binding outer membrane protein, SusD/RagB family